MVVQGFGAARLVSPLRATLSLRSAGPHPPPRRVRQVRLPYLAFRELRLSARPRPLEPLQRHEGVALELHEGGLALRDAASGRTLLAVPAESEVDVRAEPSG